MDTTAAVLAEADQELYSDDEFEVEVKAPIAPIGQKPTGKTRAEILKSAANIVAEEEEREVTAALKNVSAELQREIEDEELQVRDVPVSAGPPHTAEEASDSDEAEGGTPSEFDSVLQFACYNADMLGCKKAIRDGANVYCKDKHGWLPIHWYHANPI